MERALPRRRSASACASSFSAFMPTRATRTPKKCPIPCCSTRCSSRSPPKWRKAGKGASPCRECAAGCRAGARCATGGLTKKETFLNARWTDSTPGWCSTNATISTASFTRCGSATSPASASTRRCFRDRSCLLKSKFLEQILLQLQHGLGVREGLARDQKHVFRAITEGVDPGRLQVDVITGESAGDRIEQARPVARHDRQHVVRA